MGLLHRDLSPNNIMYRRVGGKVYGVLTDFDLSSWARSLTKDYPGTSHQRTGTPPFMAYGLLKGTDRPHLYRHDVESIFYIMIMLATRYEVRAPTNRAEGGLQMRQGLEQLPFQVWFNQPSLELLASSKRDFLACPDMKLNLSPAFRDFGNWLGGLRRAFFKGLNSKVDHRVAVSNADEMPRRLRSAPKIPEFDDETLGGHIYYSTFIDPVRELGGELRNLTVRYVPS